MLWRTKKKFFSSMRNSQQSATFFKIDLLWLKKKALTGVQIRRWFKFFSRWIQNSKIIYFKNISFPEHKSFYWKKIIWTVFSRTCFWHILFVSQKFGWLTYFFFQWAQINCRVLMICQKKLPNSFVGLLFVYACFFSDLTNFRCTLIRPIYYSSELKQPDKKN